MSHFKPEVFMRFECSDGYVRGVRDDLSQHSPFLRNVFKKMDEVQCPPEKQCIFLNNISCDELSSLFHAVTLGYSAASPEIMKNIREAANLLKIDLEETPRDKYITFKVANRRLHVNNVDLNKVTEVKKFSAMVTANGSVKCCNICFHCDDGVVCGNRNILRAYSPMLSQVFKLFPKISLMTLDATSFVNNCSRGICVPTVSFEDMEALLISIVGKLRVSVTAEKSKAIRRTAATLGITIIEDDEGFQAILPEKVNKRHELAALGTIALHGPLEMRRIRQLQ